MVIRRQVLDREGDIRLTVRLHGDTISPVQMYLRSFRDARAQWRE